MGKSFECHHWNNTKLRLSSNRMIAAAKFIDGSGFLKPWDFLLDTGAYISTMARKTAERFKVYDYKVINEKAQVGGFNKAESSGRVICVDQLVLGKQTVNDTYFFVPDDYTPISEVLGTNVLNGIIPIPVFEEKLIWFFINKNVPKPYYSAGLGVTIACEISSQDEGQMETEPDPPPAPNTPPTPSINKF